MYVISITESNEHGSTDATNANYRFESATATEPSRRMMPTETARIGRLSTTSMDNLLQHKIVKYCQLVTYIFKDLGNTFKKF